MEFRTRLDYSSNRQIKQHPETLTILSGGTSFGLTFSGLTTGPDLNTSAITQTYSSVVSTFSGNNTTTNYTWYDTRMSLGEISLTALTPTYSADTQQTVPTFSANTTTVIDGNTVNLTYTGVTFDVTVTSIYGLGGGAYSGTVLTSTLDILSASTLDFTDRTIWVDVSGITRTERLIITKNPQIGSVWTCIDSEGMGEWSVSTGSTGTDVFVTGGTYTAGTAVFTNTTGGTFSVSGFTTGSTGTTLYWYDENATPPTTTPIASGIGSIALGDGAEAINNDMFVYGANAGNGATAATYSNFIGPSAGQNSSASTNSNFFGQGAGNAATNVGNTNFLGYNAGSSSLNSYFSNFMGQNAGKNTSGASNSNFFGTSAGRNTSGTTSSNFIGNSAGYQATNASDSNFIGRQAGYQASGSYMSNFIGLSAGNLATGATRSNFIGSSAGYQSTNAFGSNFIGEGAGYQASGAGISNFLGYYAGKDANESSISNFIGQQAGEGAKSADTSNFIGYKSGYLAIKSKQSNFIGEEAGNGATGSSVSNFLGLYAGYGATDVNNSNFIGRSAGSSAISSSSSNFIGYGAGGGANNSSNSIFIGESAGYLSSGSSYSNFIGQAAGNNATGATNSNFIGYNAGNGGNNSTYSNFIGYSAGQGATGSSYSNLIGYRAGRQATSNFIGSNNIIIGTNISLPDATTNSINIGGVLFGINTYNTTAGDPSITATASGKIGIGIVTPTEGLDVALNARIRTIASLTTAGALYYDANGVLTTSTSDNRLKSNITQLTNSLDKVKQLRGVNYNWNDNLTGQTKIGFIAQEVEAVVPELTFVNDNSPEKYMGVHYDNVTALLVEAVKELSTGLTLTIPTYTPTSSNDVIGNDGNITKDNNYMYLKCDNLWKRIKLEEF